MKNTKELKILIFNKYNINVSRTLLDKKVKSYNKFEMKLTERTNSFFNSPEELDKFVTYLNLKKSKVISTKKLKLFQRIKNWFKQ